ncbi:MAG: right-handed parallel beta-helix repeat-containing protein [Pirellulaceae bacterium]|nr:right-handed parallel beta-helix repeat-containing protein [Pirellulaceae bacterium]
MSRLLSVSSLSTFALLCCLPLGGLHAQINLFVATDGSDNNSGSESSPLATLEGARNRIAAIRKEADYQPQEITVTVRSGLYELTAPLEFSEADGGSSEFPVTYRAASAEPTVLRGGITINQFFAVADEPCEFAFPDKQHVWRIDLSSLDIPCLHETSFASRTRDLHREMDAEPLHLVVDGRTQTLARWPNQGWAKATDVGLDKNSWSVETNVLGPSNFPNGPHVWAHGFWTSDWEDACHRIEFASVGSKTNFRFCDSQPFEVKADARFRIENVPSQLDLEGECFFDCESKQAYVYSQTQPPGSAFVSHLECPISFYGVSHLNFEGFSIEGARNCGVEVAGGERLALKDCEIRHVGNTCVHIYHGDSHSVTDCNLHDAGAGGIRIEAGERSTLAACNHQIFGNLIHHFSHSHLAYRPAINLIGVGIEVKGNTIHHGPHAAIILEGNDHLIVNNDISYVCLETDDVGAVYIGGNPTFRGNRIVENHIHHLGQEGRTGVIGIYLDDFASGTTVTSNVLQNMPRGIAVGGGRDNVIENNIVVDCLAAIQADARGTTWGSGFFADTESSYQRLCREAIANEVFAERYPELANALEDSPELPKGNVIVGNWIDSKIGIDLQDAPTKQLVTSERNVSGALRYLVDRGDGQFELNASGEALMVAKKLDAIRDSRYVRLIDPNQEPSPSDRAQ